MEAYLDNSATTPLCKTAKEKMLYAVENCWGNPSSLHGKGIDAHLLLCQARKDVAKALQCDEKEVFFTSGGTEGNNIAILGAARTNSRKGKKVITTIGIKRNFVISIPIRLITCVLWNVKKIPFFY